MAEYCRFECNHCQKEISGWSDNDAYYLNDNGEKVYAYHPDMDELEKCTHYESTKICLSCGDNFEYDSAEPVTKCPSCQSKKFVDDTGVGGKRCPYCKEGVFERDRSIRRVS